MKIVHSVSHNNVDNCAILVCVSLLVQCFSKYFPDKIPKSARGKAISMENLQLEQLKLPWMEVSRKAYPDSEVYAMRHLKMYIENFEKWNIGFKKFNAPLLKKPIHPVYLPRVTSRWIESIITYSKGPYV